MKDPRSDVIRVMLVDDMRGARTGFMMMLNNAPDIIVSCQAADGAQAIGYLRESPHQLPDVILMDVRMPGMSGIEAQHEMRSRGIALPIIFLTGHGDVDMAVGAVQDGAFDFLLKPVDNERFLNSVACAAWASAAAAAGLPGEDSLERLAALTKRERSLAQLIALGLTNREAAERSGIAQRTMEVHRANILRKLGVKTPEDIRRLLEMAAAEKA